MKKLPIYIFLFVCAAYLTLFAEAVGLSVSPKEVKISFSVGETANQKLKIKNPSGEVSLFEVYPDDFDSLIKVSPTSFILESGEEKEVAVQVTSKEEGVFKTNISVVASPVANSSFNAGSGVKIPLEFSALDDAFWFAAMIRSFSLSTRALGIVLLFLMVASVFFVIIYGVKQIKN